MTKQNDKGVKPYWLHVKGPKCNVLMNWIAISHIPVNL